MQTVVEIAISFNVPQVIIESDSLEVIRLLSSPEVESHPYGDMASCMSSTEEHVAMKFQHTFREVNSFADDLAHFGRHFLVGSHVLEAPVGECHRFLAQDGHVYASVLPVSTLS